MMVAAVPIGILASSRMRFATIRPLFACLYKVMIDHTSTVLMLMMAVRSSCTYWTGVSLSAAAIQLGLHLSQRCDPLLCVPNDVTPHDILHACIYIVIAARERTPHPSATATCLLGAPLFLLHVDTTTTTRHHDPVDLVYNHSHPVQL